MTDEIRRLEKRIDELTERVRRLEARGTADTADVDTAAAETAAAPRVDDSRASSAAGIPAALIMTLVGRTLIVLGGAFLLRWLTQSGILPQRPGAIAGVLYAVVWIVMADVSAGRGNRYSAAFHAVTAAMIALPLLVEVTTKLHYLTPMLSALHLPAFIILGLVVAWRRNLRILAWIVTVPAAPLAFLLAVQTNATTPFLISLLILGLATLWLGYLRHWHVLATMIAAAVNIGLALVVMEYVAVSNRVDAEPETALWQILFLLFALIALYFGSYCFRVFRRRRTITPIEIGNTLVVLLVGVGGAALVINASDHSMLPLGIVCLALAVASYTAAYGFLPRRDPNRRNFVFYTLLALVMVVLGVEILLPRPAAAVVLTLTALIAGVLSTPIRSPILYLHGAVYLVAAMFRSGLVAATKNGLIGQSAQLTDWFHAAPLLALAVTIAYPWLKRPEGRRSDMRLGKRAAAVCLFVTVLAVSALAVSLVATARPQEALLASTRTGALALSAAILAWYTRRTRSPRFGKLSWMVYTILVLGAIKLAAEDIAAGGAATLFVSLGFYGGALILAPRLLHGSGERNVESEQAGGAPGVS